MKGLIKISDLMQHMRDNGLVIVKATELAETHALQAERKKQEWLKQKSMTYAQAATVLRISVRTLKRRIEAGAVNKNETLQKGGVHHILTIAVKRLAGM